MALFILAFLFVEETTYKRTFPSSPAIISQDEKHPVPQQIETVPVKTRKTFVQTLKPWSGINHEAEFFTTIWRSFTYYLVPSVFWVVTTYGE